MGQVLLVLLHFTGLSKVRFDPLWMYLYWRGGCGGERRDRGITTLEIKNPTSARSRLAIRHFRV